MKQKEMKGTRRQRIFNGLYAFLIIMGLLVSVLGLRARARQASANVFTPTQRVGPSAARGTPTVQLKPDEVALTRRQEGGVSGACETAQVQVDGQLDISHCSATRPLEPRTFKINSDQLDQLQAWVLEFQPFEADYRGKRHFDACSGTPGLPGPGTERCVFTRPAGERDQSRSIQTAIVFN